MAPPGVTVLHWLWASIRSVISPSANLQSAGAHIGQCTCGIASGLSKIVLWHLPLPIVSSQGRIDLAQRLPCCGPDGLGMVIP